MKITQCKIYRYQLPLFRPIHPELKNRAGLLIQLIEQSGVTGWGEIAPLPGFSAETLQQATEEALKLKHDISFQPTLPSVQCGIELAREDLESRMAGRLPFVWFTENPKKNSIFSVTKLLLGSENEILKSAQSALRSGFAAVKMKVGHLPLIEGIDLVWQVREILGENVSIRLDANRAWSMDQACRFGNGIAACKIDFIEEPLQAGLQQHRSFYEMTGIPVALDETLYQQTDVMKIFETSLKPWVRAFVLKPMLIGGFKICQEIASKASALNINTILSSSYESGLMTQAIARFAQVLPAAHELSLGIDTYENLADDTLSPRIKVMNGKINLSTIPYPPKIKTELLEEIT